MGMFDSFIGYWRCPDCNQSGEIEVQTKELDCLLIRYHTGMVVDNPNRPDNNSYTIEEGYWCHNCSMEQYRDEDSGLTWDRLKDRWKEWKVNIVIENGRFKELVFTGEYKILGVNRRRD